MRPLNGALLVALAVGGWAALWHWLPRLEPLVLSGHRMDRQQALRLAREAASRYGVDAGAWRPSFETSSQSRLSFLHALPAAEALDPLAGPLYTRVTLRSRSGPDQVVVHLSGVGRLVGFERKGALGPVEGSATLPVAERVLRDVVGPDAARFRLTTDGAVDKEFTRYRWEGESPRGPALRWAIDVALRGARAHSVGLTHTLSPDVERRASSGKLSMSVPTTLLVVVTLVGIVLAPALGVWAWLRGGLRLRLALSLAALAVLLRVGLALTAPSSPMVSADYVESAEWTGELFGLLFAAMGVLIFVSVGDTFAGPERHRWTALRLFGQGRLWARPVGVAVAIGVALAGPVAALPYLVSRLAVLGVAPLDVPLHDHLVSPTPALRAVFGVIPVYVIAYFACVIPVAVGLLGRYRWTAPLRWLVAFACMLTLGTIDDNARPVVASGLLLGTLLEWTYRGHGLLAVLCAASGSILARNAIVLLHLPSPVWSEAGRHLLGGLGAAFVASVACAFLGRRVTEDADPAAHAPALTFVSEREQLKGAFGLAHEAQQRMLPSAPPRLPGFDIAATCQPARDVGGDLYDYVLLPDGRQALCVADVSGKGMPAALYMTLTKGLLAAAAQDCRSLPEIAQRLNAHLYTACARKMFVTAALGALDPARRQFEYVRAGHNPPVWHSPSRGETQLLRATGMGLGVGSPKVFDRTLRPEKLELQPGDALVLYSDGVTEAMDRTLEQFGEERLMESIARCDGLGATQTRDRILADLAAFLDGVAPQDDVTVLVLRAEAAAGV